MLFIIILVLTTLSIAGSAAFFSIYGLAQIFSASFWPVVIMSSSLEVGKLVTASYLYRFWRKIGFALKTYLISAIVVLMLITSAGIFGFLSSAHQKDILPLEQMQQQVVLLNAEKVELEALKLERLSRQQQINNEIAGLPSNYVKGRQRLMTSYGPELTQLRSDVQQYTADIRAHTLKIQELKSKTLETQAEIGPIIFIAKALGQDTTNATSWLILLIIFAFDPLAVALTIATNNALLERDKAKPEPEPVMYTPPQPEKPEPTRTFSSREFYQQSPDFQTVVVKEPITEVSSPEVPLSAAEIDQRIQDLMHHESIKEILKRKPGSTTPAPYVKLGPSALD